MHIPEHMVNAPVAVTTNALAFAGVVLAGLKISSGTRLDAARFAAVTSLIFAAQMLNFPVLHGTSGHLVGGVLAASLLGIPAAVLSMTIVLAVQALLFGDGGVISLGANIMNMALIGAGLGGWLKARFEKRGWPLWLTLILSSWISVMVAAVACSLEVAFSGVARWSEILPAMAGVHAAIGVSEALITVGLFVMATTVARTSAVLAVAACVMAVFSPLASAWPDGFESVLHRLNAAVPAVSSGAWMADYQVPALSGEALSTVLAGLIGVAVVYALSRLMGLIPGKE